MRQPLVGRTATDIDNAFAIYGGLAGGHPEQCNSDAGEPSKQVVECREGNRRDNHLGKATGRVYRILEEACRETDQIARQSETQQLSLAIREDLVPPGEAAAQNEDAPIGTALSDDIAVAIEPPFRPMEVAKERDLNWR